MKTILFISIMLQLIAVFYAFRLIRLTKKYFAWMLIASAISLMAVRRIISLVALIGHPMVAVSFPTAEYVALAISGLLALGIVLIEPLFKSIKKNELELGLKNIILKDNNTQIKQINEELISAKEKAEESNRLKSAFLANLSHEIRTPMNGILGFTDLLKSSDLSSDKRDDYIRIIHKSGNHLLSVITDIIEISKIDSGLIKPNYSSIEINGLILHIFETSKIVLSDDKDLKLILDNTSNEITYIISDEVKLIQIITNLITNAIKYTDKGSIHVGYNLNKENQLLFYVKDTGVGIPEKYHKSIFGRFFQVESDITIKKGGSGLGLAITNAYIQMLKGKIWLESEVNKGSTFTFRIPISLDKENYTEDREIKDREITGNIIKKEILVVEDDDTNYLLISEILADSNLGFLRAKNGEIAVEMCKNNNEIAIVLMDIKMPVMDGYQALKEIRIFNKSIPVIAQTAYTLSDEISKIRNSGFDGIIDKPLRKDELLDIIADHIDI